LIIEVLDYCRIECCQGPQGAGQITHHLTVAWQRSGAIEDPVEN
jgi:hypothetical protein